MKKYFQLLGVNHQSTIDDIEKAYQSRLKALDVLPVDDEAYIKVKRKRLKEAYYAVLLHRETGKVLPDDFEGGADAVEQMLVKARLEKSGKPKSVKIKSKNKGNWMVLVLIVAVLGVAVELIPVKRFEPAQYVDLSQYEQAEERDLHIAEIAEASKQYILEYAEEHPREYVQGGTLRGDSRKTVRCEREFLETYWGCESFGEVADILNETYEAVTDEETIFAANLQGVNSIEILSSNAVLFCKRFEVLPRYGSVYGEGFFYAENGDYSVIKSYYEMSAPFEPYEAGYVSAENADSYLYVESIKGNFYYYYLVD